MGMGDGAARGRVKIAPGGGGGSQVRALVLGWVSFLPRTQEGCHLGMRESGCGTGTGPLELSGRPLELRAGQDDCKDLQGPRAVHGLRCHSGCTCGPRKVCGPESPLKRIPSHVVHKGTGGPRAWIFERLLLTAPDTELPASRSLRD